MELLNRRPGSPTSKQPLKIFIVSSNNATFELSIFGGTSDMALHRAVATRMGVPPAYSDGSESFYVADEEGRVLPLTESLPDGIKLVVKLTEPPPAAPRRQPSASASFIRRPVEQPSGSPLTTPPANVLAAAQPSTDPNEQAASKLQAVQRGRLARAATKRGMFDVAECLRACGLGDCLLPWQQGGKYLPMGKDEPQNDDDEDTMVRGMARLSRLATDLANERTLLAWIRTILAVVRTAFATLAWAPGVTLAYLVVHRLSVVLVVLLLVASTVVGLHRYYRIARVVKMKEIPLYFGRLPMGPMNSVFALSVLTVSVGMIAQTFELLPTDDA